MINEALVTNGKKARIAFDSGQYARLRLSCTVAVPPTLPEPGTIELAESPEVNSRIVCITQLDSPTRIIRRFIRLDDIRAVAAAGDDRRVDCSDLQRFLFGDELMARLQDCSSPLLGVAFVNEQAQMLVQFETTMAACEDLSSLMFATRNGNLLATVPPGDRCCNP